MNELFVGVILGQSKVVTSRELIVSWVGGAGLQLREFDKEEVATPMMRVLGGHFGRCRTSIAILMALCLWVS